MAYDDNMEQYRQTLWMHHFSIRLMQLHQGMHASLAMRLAADAWRDANDRDPEEVARELDQGWLRAHTGPPVGRSSSERQVAAR